MKRKRFLIGSSLGLAGFTLQSHGFLLPGASKKVIVVGAGMAGVSAGRALRDAGCEVIILEGRERIGGRIWTDNSMGMPVDLGAGWIEESTGNPIAKITQQAGIETSISNFDNLALYDFNAKRFSEDEISEIYRLSQNFGKEALHYAGRQDQDISYQRAVNELYAKSDYTEEERRLINWRLSTEEISAAIEFDKMSAWGDTEKGWSGDYLVVPGGFDQVPKNLGRDLDIRLNITVTEIEQNESRVIVRSKNEEFDADYVIVTVPLGVLQQGNIKFIPELSEMKRSAIAELGMGNMNKLAIQFQEPFWPAENEFIGLISDVYGEIPVLVNWNYYSGKPVLMATMSNGYSEMIDNVHSDQLPEFIQKILSKFFPEVPLPAMVRFSGWKWDPFATGSYSYLPTGVNPEKHEWLAEPEGRIHFAGEATMRYYTATVQGAYLSGLREAERIMKY